MELNNSVQKYAIPIMLAAKLFTAQYVDAAENANAKIASASNAAQTSQESQSLQKIRTSQITQPQVACKKVQYRAGKTTVLEQELNIDLIGKTDECKVADIADVVRSVQVEYPKTKPLELIVKFQKMKLMEYNGREMERGGFAKSNVQLTPEEIEMMNLTDRSNYIFFDRDSNDVRDLIVLNSEHARFNPNNLFVVDGSFKGSFTHELGHIVTGKDEPGSFQLAESYVNIDDKLEIYLTGLAKERKTTVDEESARFKNKRGHYPGAVSDYARFGVLLNCKDYEKTVQSLNALLDDKPHILEDDYAKTLETLRNLVEFYTRNVDIGFRMDSLDTLDSLDANRKSAVYLNKHYIESRASEDLAENFVALHENKAQPEDPVIEIKQKALKEYLDKTWK